MADIGWRRRRGSSPAARRGARQRAGLTPASASNTLSCQRETLHSQQLRSIKKTIDSDHGIYRDLRNVAANYPFERSRKFRGIQPNSGNGDCSRFEAAVATLALIFAKTVGPSPSIFLRPPRQPTRRTMWARNAA